MVGHVISGCDMGKDVTHSFFGGFDTGRDLIIGCKGFVLVGIDLVFAKNWKRRLDAQLLDANLA